MTPTIHCIRHAQGYHNLNVANHSIHDPALTPYGEEQCRTLQKNFSYLRSVDLVVASPLKRTINTALITFEPVLKEKDLRVIGLPELQETSDLPCDTGSSPDGLAWEYESKPVDLGLVKDGWDSKKGRWAPTAAAIEKRAKDARTWLMQRPEKNIVVVTHGGFLHYFTEDWSDGARFQGTGWANTEYRSYTFTGTDTSEPHLTETAESKRRRSGTEKPIDHNEATQLKRTTTMEREREKKDYLEKQKQLEAAAAAGGKGRDEKAKV